MAKRKRAQLTEREWAKVFTARCQSKQGRPISEEERALLTRAFETDEKRYAEMDREIFNATVPFGSSAKWK